MNRRIPFAALALIGLSCLASAQLTPGTVTGGGATKADLKTKLDRTDLVAGYRQAVGVSGFTRTSVLIIGDSMIGRGLQDFRRINAAALDETSMAWADGGVSGGASVESDACVKWITGDTYRLTGSGHTATFGSSVTNAVAGNTLKVYYLKQSGGGVFKVQSERTKDGVTDAWADEAGYTAVDSSNASNAGAVISITKTDYRASWRVRAVWVSGGTVNVIGAGVVDTQRYGAKVAIMYNSSTSLPSNNLDSMSTTEAAIIDPIFADLAPQLCMMSHLDGAAFVNSYQATVQDRISTAVSSGGAAAPSWLTIGPPSGYNSSLDTANAAQADAMNALAASRGEAFFDNRTWMGGVTNALAKGYMVDADVHPTAKAFYYTVPAIYEQSGLANGEILNASARTGFRIVGSGAIRGQLGALGLNEATELAGTLRLANPHGKKDQGVLYLEDTDGPVNTNDAGFFRMKANALELGHTLAAITWKMDSPLGNNQFYNPSSTTSSPNGTLGTSSAPMREMWTANLFFNTVAQSGAGAVSVAAATTKLTTTGSSQAITLANGTDGQIKTIIHTVDGGSAILTPATPLGFATITFTNAGDTAVLQYSTTVGWSILSLNGATKA